MANYIHNTNQTLLWNTVNKIPEFQNLSPPKKDFQFKQIIEYFYHKCNNKPILSIQELQQINRDTILAFIPNNKKPPLHPNKSSNFVESKQEQSQRQFEERQNVYKQMNAKPELPSPEIFKMKEEDTAIENMDILIKQYQKQRDIEFPPPSTSLPKKKVRILNDVNIDVFETDIIDLELEKKKNVSWSINQNQEYTNEDYWEKKIIQLEEQFNLRLNEIENRLETILIKQEVEYSLDKIIQQIK
jgi:hypothetical protein